MTSDDVLDLFLDHGGLLKGHFKLSSGLHSDTYLQCAKVLMHPPVAARLAQALAKAVVPLIDHVDVVVSPAMGGLIIGHEVARAMGHPFVFCERVDGTMTFRRGFALEAGQKVVIVEDVVTTGKSTREVIALVQGAGATVRAACSIINRSGAANPFEDIALPFAALARVDAKAYPEDQLPPELAAVPLTTPGSRFLK